MIARPRPDAPPGTVKEAVTYATRLLAEGGSETPRLDAELLLGHVLGVERSALAAHPEAPLGHGQVSTFAALLARRADGEPVAYIRGLKEFYGAAIVVDRRVLIPRPETEALVGLALERIRGDMTASPRPAGTAPYLVWDVGTGSGAIVVALGRELRRLRYGEAVRFHASDVSVETMEVATINVVAHGLADIVTLAPGDLCDTLPAPPPVDLLVANLPYVPSSSLPSLPVAASFEPSLSLDGGSDGLAVVRRLLPQLPTAVSSHGAALLEVGSDQADAIAAAVAETLPGWRCRIHPDLGGRPRVAELERPVA
jgi:release factor glutamine methyltransferase